MPRDLDWLEKIAAACEEDRTPEREAELTRQLETLHRRLRDEIRMSVKRRRK